MIRAAKNGRGGKITFLGRYVYYNCNSGIPFSSLGFKLNKTSLLKKLINNKNLREVEMMLVDWELYENAWYVGGNHRCLNTNLYYYLCQIHYKRPIALKYFDK